MEIPIINFGRKYKGVKADEVLKKDMNYQKNIQKERYS